MKVLTNRDEEFPCPPKLFYVVISTLCGVFLLIVHWYWNVGFFYASSKREADLSFACRDSSVRTGNVFVDQYMEEYNLAMDRKKAAVVTQANLAEEAFNNQTSQAQQLVDSLVNTSSQLADSYYNGSSGMAGGLVDSMRSKTQALRQTMANYTNITIPGLPEVATPNVMDYIPKYEIFGMPIFVDFLYGMSCEEIHRLIEHLSIVLQVIGFLPTFWTLWMLLRLVKSVKHDLLRRFRATNTAEVEAYNKKVPPGYQLSDYIKFGGYQVIFAMVAWIVLAIILGALGSFLLCLFEFKLVRDYIFNFLDDRAAMYTATVGAAILLSLLQRFAATYCQMKDRGTSSQFTLRYRTLFAILDLGGILFNSAVGVFGYIMRLMLYLWLTFTRVGRCDITMAGVTTEHMKGELAAFVDWFDIGHTSYKARTISAAAPFCPLLPPAAPCAPALPFPRGKSIPEVI